MQYKEKSSKAHFSQASRFRNKPHKTILIFQYAVHLLKYFSIINWLPNVENAKSNSCNSFLHLS